MFYKEKGDIMKYKLYLLITVLILFAEITFGQVETTLTGGPWTSPSTWKDGVVPAPGDNVLIRGPVTLDLITIANSIQITNTGSLVPENIGITTYKLNIANYLWNDGTINGYNLELFIGGSIAGSIYNSANGNWNSGDLHIVDTLSHAFLSEGVWFSPSNFRADSATLVSAGNIEIDSSSLYARKIVLGNNLQYEKMTFDHNSVLHVEEFINNSSDTTGIEFRNNSYISISPISGTTPRFTDVILKGDVGISTNIFFYGNTSLYGNMYYPYGGYSITSIGPFQNNGEIVDLYFSVYGNLINNGNWTGGTINMVGISNHILEIDTSYSFAPDVFRSDSSTILSNSNLRFDNADVVIKTLILQNTNNLTLNNSRFSGTLEGNGNKITMNNNSNLGASSFENVIFSGNVGVDADILFYGNCYLNGNIYPQYNSTHKITSNGLFQNNGEIKRYGTTGWGFTFDISGNLENTGIWNSNGTSLIGSSDQHLGIKDTSSIDILRIYANRGGNSFQWMLNGSPLSNGGKISGATAQTLIIQDANVSESGTYSCQIDSSGNTLYSRNILINNIVTKVDEDQSQTPDNFVLYQNYPNPFNPGTIINYQLPVPSNVSLIVYDILGRSVEELTNSEQSAGYHKINWNPKVSTGVYFYRITAASADNPPIRFSQTRKLLFIK